MAGVCCLKLSKLQACGSCFTLVSKPLAMPVVPAVVPPLSSFRDGSSRPTMEARRGGSHGQGQPVAHEPVSRVPRGAGAEASREGAVRRDQEGGRRDTRDAGRRRDGGGERPSRPHTHLPPDRAQARRGRRGGQAGGQGRDHAARAAPGARALRAGTGRRGRGATTRAPSALASRPPGGTSGGSPTGAARGGGNAPDGGLTAAATGPSRQCRCRDGPLWGVTKAPGYAGGSLLRAHLELGAGFQDPEFGRDAYSCHERANPSGFANATGAFIRRDSHDVRSQKECKRLRLPSKRSVLSQRCRWVVT